MRRMTHLRRPAAANLQPALGELLPAPFPGSPASRRPRKTRLPNPLRQIESFSQEHY